MGELLDKILEDIDAKIADADEFISSMPQSHPSPLLVHYNGRKSGLEGAKNIVIAVFAKERSE